MDLYVPWEVYQNIKPFCTTRKINLETAFLNEAQFIQHLNTYEYIKLTGTGVTGNKVFIILIAMGSKYATNVPVFKKLMNTFKPADLIGNELIFLSEHPFTNFIRKHLLVIKKEIPSSHIESHDYNLLITDITKHPLVPLHEKITDKELTDLCNKLHVDKTYFQAIGLNDPPVVWIGGRIGDVIRIYRLSETTGETVVYRRVVRAQ